MFVRGVRRAGLAWAAAAALLLASSVPAWAQATGSVRGKVIDAVTQRPLAGAQVSIPGSGLGGLANSSGDFLILNVPAGTHTVSAVMIGYGQVQTEVTVTAGEAAVANFELSQSAIGLDEIVVTGTPGATQRRAVGNAVSSLAVEELTEKAPVTNVTQLLQGRTPGLTMMQASGQAGTAANFRIRGAGSLNAGNHPVFYVDGVRITSGSYGGFGTANNTRRETSALDMLNPDDIESIEVIKGPAAATLYGADAAAGVIQIITKKGRKGQQAIQWSAKAEYGQTDWHLPMRKNYTLCTTEGELAHTSTSIARIGHKDWPGCDGMDPNAPWQERLLVETPLANPGVLRTGQQQSYTLSARGGGDNYSFYVSGDREDEDGVFSNNYFERTSGRANFTVTPTENLDVSFSSLYSQTETRQPLNDNASHGWLRNSWRGRPGWAAPYEMGWRGLGPEQMRMYNDVTASERFVLGSTIDYQPVSWFRNRVTLGLDAGDRKITLFYPIGSDAFSASYAQGYISNLDRSDRNYTVNYSGTITTDITDDVSSSLSFGMQYARENYRNVQTVGEGLISNVVRNIDVDNNLDTRVYESTRQERSLGYFIEEQIGWKNRLFLTGAVRIDDHSAFGKNFETIYYPKVATSYVISEESFFNLPHVSSLRLRAAYGHAGNAPAPFSADRTYGSSTVILADETLSSALTPNAYGNPDLKAERGTELELGFDGSLFDDAIALEFTYYNKTTKDALLSIPNAPVTGFTGSRLENAGEISNSGIELSISATPVRTPDVIWDIQGVFATNNNKLVSLANTRGEENFIPVGYRSSQRHAEGFPLAGYWADEVLYDADGNLLLDDAGRPVLSDTMTYVGPSAPTREFALTNSVTLFGNLHFYVFMDYKGGHYLFNMSDQTSINDANHRLANDPTVSEEEWLIRAHGGNRPFIEKADFIKLREISVSYDLPSRWVHSFGADGMSITLAGRNLAVWSDYSGADPEVNIGGASTFTRGESNSVPMMRRLVATLNVRF